MKKFITFLDTRPLFLILVPLYVLVHLEKVFFGLIRYRFVITQIIVLFFASVIMIFLSGKLFRQKNKAAAMAITLLLVWCYFGPLKNNLHYNWPDSLIQGYAFLIPLSAALIASAYFLIRIHKGEWFRLFRYMNTLWIIFILADMVMMVRKSISTTDSAKKYALSLPAAAVTDNVKPDIYYVVFDGYARHDVLVNMGFDNSRVEQQLESLGFRIINGSQSNYNLTPFSIGCTLNMRYLDEADTVKKYYLNDYLPALDIVRRNGLFPYLLSNGYHILNYSIFDFPGAPNTIPTHDIWDLDNLYLQHNAALKIFKDLSWHFSPRRENLLETTRQEMRTRMQYDSTVYRKLRETVETAGQAPRFIYGHFYFPHSPNCYDSSGRVIRFKADMSPEEDRDRYTGEIRYVNRKIVELAKDLIRQKGRPLVIIFQGDHGYRTYGTGRPKDEFKNFNAIYFSNGDYSKINDSLTNVNLFRSVLDTYLGIPLNPTRLFI